MRVLEFVGPPPETLEMLGNKLAARRSAAAAVPIVPGTTVALGAGDADVASVGFPLMLKAAAGGGGRGMRRVEAADALPAALEAARREAGSVFGDPTIYAERVLAPARHVEVLLGDRHGGLAVLGERDCSVQRRHQKLVEESPSPAVDRATREALRLRAARVAGSVAFHNAATVEFLLDADGKHYFLEMNTRLQVEHGVTELVTGLDIVAWQIRIAAGERLPGDILAPSFRGHAVEVRLYAEDPYRGFAPTAGRIGAWRMPSGAGVRVDAGVEADTDLRPEYDPLLAKLMVHAEDRPSAIARLRRALDETLIGGVQTDAGFLRWLVDDAAFAKGDYDTGLIADRWDGARPPDAEEAALAAVAAAGAREALAAGGQTRASPAADGSAWARQARQEALRR